MSAYSLVVNPGAIAFPLLLDYDALLPLYLLVKSRASVLYLSPIIFGAGSLDE